jgi:hypothetical protein
MATKEMTFAVVNHEDLKIGEIRVSKNQDSILSYITVIGDDDKDWETRADEDTLASIEVRRDGALLTILPAHLSKGYFGCGVFSNLLTAVYKLSPELFDGVKDVEITDEDEFENCISQYHQMRGQGLENQPSCIPVKLVKRRMNKATDSSLAYLYEDIVDDFCFGYYEDDDDEEEEEVARKRVKCCDA